MGNSIQTPEDIQRQKLLKATGMANMVELQAAAEKRENDKYIHRFVYETAREIYVREVVNAGVISVHLTKDDERLKTLAGASIGASQILAIEIGLIRRTKNESDE